MSRPSARQRILRYGAGAGIVGSLLAILLPMGFNAVMRSQLKLFEGGEMYKNWETFPLSVTTKFHFFHVLNPEEAMNGAKVRLKEVGPFVFDQWRRKEVIEWGPKQETIKYWEYKKFLYRPDLSNGDWDMDISTVNPVVAGVAAVLEDTLRTVPLIPTVISPFLYTMVSGILMAHGHNLFLKTTPRQLLLGHRINIFDTVQSILEPLEVFGLNAEDLLPTDDMPNNAFGILNGKNNTRGGPWEIYTGQGDTAEKYASVISYKGMTKWDKWSEERCNVFQGTDGAQFPAFRKKTDRMPIFAADLCRTLTLVYEKEDEFNGIPVWKMKLDPKIWQPPSVNPDNECFCMHKKRKDRCNIKGLIDLGGCLKGGPLVATSPHFLSTDPFLGDLVEGVSPDPKKHGFEVLFEPRIGAPVSAKGRIQLSVRVEKTSFLRGFSDIKNAFIPFVWVEEAGGLDDTMSMVLRVALSYVIDGSQNMSYAVAGGGWLTFLAAITYGILCPPGTKSEKNPKGRESGERPRKPAPVPSPGDTDDEVVRVKPSITQNLRKKLKQVRQINPNNGLTGYDTDAENAKYMKDAEYERKPFTKKPSVKRAAKPRDTPRPAGKERVHLMTDAPDQGKASSPPPVEEDTLSANSKTLILKEGANK